MDAVNHTVSIPAILNSWAKEEVKRRKSIDRPRYSMGDLIRDGLRAIQEGTGVAGTEGRSSVQISSPQIPEKSGSGNIAPLSKPTCPDCGVILPCDPIQHREGCSASRMPEVMSKTRAKILAVVKPTAAELAAKTAAIKDRFGIKTLATIEEVEPRLDAESGYIQPNVATGVVDDDLRREFVAEFGRQVWDRAIRIPSFKKAKWPERFEMAREQKERGE
jgi:hypothetical protein